MKFLSLLAVLLLLPFFVLAGQGCCSWHGGECGCSSTGNTICCDGTLSPSCTCYVPPKEPVEKTKPNKSLEEMVANYSTESHLKESQERFDKCISIGKELQNKNDDCAEKLSNVQKTLFQITSEKDTLHFFIILFIIGVPTISFFAYNRQEKKWFEVMFWVCFSAFLLFVWIYFSSL